MPWLKIPHIRQTEPGWCLPACVAMVAAYWGQPILQDDVARWLDVRTIGTASSRIQWMERRGFQVMYRIGSLVELETQLKQDAPCILFVRTGELPNWKLDTPHAIVLAGLENEQAHLFDPAIETAPVTVLVGDLMLAWSYSDYTYAVLTPSQ